jgi:hypothetical protein
MSKNVTRFPMSTWQRIRNRRGKMAVSCIVSDRWLRFHSLYRDGIEMGTPIALDVVTNSHGHDGNPRKICSLIVTVEELRALVAEIDLQLATDPAPA